MEKNNTILIVDDNAANRLLLKAMLESAGYETDEVVNGQECVEYCEKHKPLLILLDVMMPVMDGIKACSELREKYSQTELPIIMVTTKVAGSDLAAGFKAGADDYITKPVDRNILITRIENQIKLFQSQQNLEQQKLEVEKIVRIQSAMGDALIQAIAVHDFDGNILYVNEALRCGVRFEECKKLESVFQHLFGGLLMDDYEERLKSIAGDREEIIDEELVIQVQRSERVFYVKSKVVNLSDTNGVRIWIFNDVTAERMVEQKANQQVKMETVGLFAAGVAHNFNNLLGSILGAADIIERSHERPERLARCTDIIRDAVSSGMRFTKKMSLTRKREDIEKALTTNFGSTLTSVWDELSASGESPKIDYVFDESLNELDVAISKNDLEVVLKNLLQNAVDAVSESGEVVCALSEIDERRSVASVTLHDTGHGMDEDTLTRAFEPFFSTRNLDHTNNVSVEGKGLGMWNAYSIVRMASGDITLHSTPEQGSTAVLILPLAKD